MRLSDVSVCGPKAAAVLAVAFSLCLDVSAQLLDAFEHGDFESSLSHGRRGKYAEVARGFGRNGNGGARLSGFVRHSFALPVKESLVLRRGERYIFSLDVCNHGKRDIIEQIAFEVYDAKTGRYDHGYWGRTVKDLGDGWHREELAFVPKRDLKASAESLRFILFVQLDPHRKPAIPVGLPENKIDCDNAVLRRDAPIWSFHNTWPTHNRIDPVEGRVRGYSSFVGPFVSSNAALRYEMVLRDGKARRLCAVTAREEAGVLEAAFGPIRHQGPAQLAVRLFADNVFVAERTRAVTVAPPPVLRPTDVEIDDRGRTLVGGRPFMPLGFYSNFANPQRYKPEELEPHFKRLKDAGFNFLIDYGAYLLRTKRQRDHFYGLCSRYGIRVLANDFAGLQIRTNEIATCGRKAQELAQYPAIIGWYTMDEASEDKIPVLERIRRALNEATPGLVTHSCNIMAPPPYLGVSDVQGGDIYPIDAGENRTLAGGENYMARAAACRPAAAWHAPQALNWANYRRGGMDSREAYLKSGREPEENEMLSVALAYASHGVQGFTFYSYFDLSRGPFPEWYEKRWEKVVRVAAALRSLEPFILSGYRPRELPHQDGCDRTRIVIMADGKKNYRVLAIGLGAKHKTSFTLPKKVGRLTSRCGRTTEKNGVYTFTGPAFSCDILEAPDHR